MALVRPFGVYHDEKIVARDIGSSRFERAALARASALHFGSLVWAPIWVKTQAQTLVAMQLDAMADSLTKRPLRGGYACHA